jgi:hypothetical protein
MLAIVVIVLSFIAALLGLANSYAAKPEERSYTGLTRLGLALVVLATLGMIFGVAKEISGIRAAAQLAQADRERSQMLKEIYAQVVGAKGAATDPKVVEQLAKLADQISAAASLSRESDLRMSDFSRSNFTAGNGNFTQASFRNALFREADLRGADLGTALIDEQTRLPQR